MRLLEQLYIYKIIIIFKNKKWLINIQKWKIINETNKKYYISYLFSKHDLIKKWIFKKNINIINTIYNKIEIEIPIYHIYSFKEEISNNILKLKNQIIKDIDYRYKKIMEYKESLNSLKDIQECDY